MTIYTANVRHKKTTFLHEHFLVLMDCHKGSSIVHNKNGTVMTFCRVLKCIPINTSYKPDQENMYIEPTLFIGPSINTWKWLFLWGKRVHFTVSYYIIIIKVYMQNCPIDFFSKIKVFKITAHTAPQVTEASRPHWSHAVIIHVCCNMHASKVSSTFTTYMM